MLATRGCGVLEPVESGRREYGLAKDLGRIRRLLQINGSRSERTV